MEPVSKLREAFEAIRAMALAAQSTFEKIETGSLPVDDSMVMTIGAGGEVDIALDLHGDQIVDIVCNAKHRVHATVIDVLSNVHRELTTSMHLPSGDGWQVLSIATSSLPTFIEKDGDQFLYGSGFNAKIWIQ